MMKFDKILSKSNFGMTFRKYFDHLNDFLIFVKWNFYDEIFDFLNFMMIFKILWWFLKFYDENIDLWCTVVVRKKFYFLNEIFWFYDENLKLWWKYWFLLQGIYPSSDSNILLES